jgi:hypothetical protein
MRTIDEYRSRTPTMPRSATVAHLRPIAQEAVRMEALTGDPAWDHFLAYLEAGVKNTQRMIDHEKTKLCHSALVNDEAIRALKAQITALESRLATLKEVILLPKYLKEQATLARAQIDDLTKGAAGAPPPA